LKVTIITATYNSAGSIRKNLESVRQQTHNNIEHLIIDGASSDDTLDIVNGFQHVSKVVSEKDKGIYDALNKGLSFATGDVIGLLHSDDVFHDRLSIARVVSQLVENPEFNGVYGDIRFVNEEGKTTRLYSCKNWEFKDFAQGIMPAHPSFFAKKEVYHNERFSLNYKIASDFELLVRLFKKPLNKFKYMPYITTDMSSGGLSTRSWRSNLIINKEIRQICRKHNIKTSYLKIYSKYIKRLLELR